MKRKRSSSRKETAPCAKRQKYNKPKSHSVPLELKKKNDIQSVQAYSLSPIKQTSFIDSLTLSIQTIASHINKLNDKLDSPQLSLTYLEQMQLDTMSDTTSSIKTYETSFETSAYTSSSACDQYE